MDDYALLGLGKATSLVERVGIDEGGGVVVLSCIYDPQGIKLRYRLSFTGCRSVSWDQDPPADEPILPADLLGISLGADRHRSPAVLTTDTFELSFFYESFALQTA